MYSYGDCLAAAEYIKSRSGGHRPEIMVVLGSGLGGIADLVEDASVIPYSEIPGFAVSTAPDHAGRLITGRLAGREVMVMQGRFHYYEGYEPEQIVFPVNVAHVMGVKQLVLTNAAGAVNTDYSVGDIMLISDHIKLCAATPCRGENSPELGQRFFDMSYTYSPHLRDIARANAKKLGISLREGVYFYFAGPQFETPAEIRAARLLGGDAVGMSTVYEAIAAAHCGMEVLGLSLMTNMAAGVLPEKLSGSDVVQTAERMKKPFSELVMACISDMEGK